MSAYIHDVLSQPIALKFLADQFNVKDVFTLKQRIEKGEFDRIIISGMGASYYAAYPAYLILTQLPIPVMFVNAAELVNYLPDQIGPRTLLWLNSQSGHSAEVVHLIEKFQKSDIGGLIACVNDLDSPLAHAADYCWPIFAGEEATVSVKTYTNMVAVNKILSLLITSNPNISQLKSALEETADKTQKFLVDYKNYQTWLANSIENADTLFFLGRGASMAAVWTGSLINKEAAKCSFEGMNSADFRHGPMEMVREGVSVIIFAGDRISRPLNHQLACEIQQFGGNVTWVDYKPDPDLPTFLLPDVPEDFRPVVEILPMQLITMIMAEKQGFEPGIFHIVGKITTVE